jgi:hypothetical protein
MPHREAVATLLQVSSCSCLGLVHCLVQAPLLQSLSCLLSPVLVWNHSNGIGSTALSIQG